MIPRCGSACGVTIAECQLANLRDLGGLPLVGGGQTRESVLYRSDASYEGDSQPEHVPVWPPATVIDLRSDAETDVWPHPWSSVTSVHHHPLFDAARLESLSDIDGLTGLYAAILDQKSDQIGSLLRHAAEAHGPVLVNCAAGKDRTGIVVAALLLAAGVEPSAVVADYRATELNIARLLNRWEAKGVSHGHEIPASWLEAPEEAINLVISRIAGCEGGSIGWWLDHGATRHDLDVWRSKLAGGRVL
jgi:protein-tyrosine phosphatase